MNNYGAKGDHNEFKVIQNDSYILSVLNILTKLLNSFCKS